MRLMTSDDAKRRALPYVGEEDLLLLAADLGPGYFEASYLYDAYAAAVAEEGRTPVSKKRFGLDLKAAGWQSSRRYVGDERERRQARCWLINKPWFRRGQKMLADELAASQADTALSTGQKG